MPTSSAASASSAVARIIHPARVLDRNTCRAPNTTTATTRITMPRAETDRPLVICQLDVVRSEEHTSELQSRSDLVCRLLLEKKKKYLSCFANGILASTT